MSRSLLRPLLLLVLILALLLPCQGWAEADAARVYIALNHSGMFPVALPLAYYAEQTGADVTMLDTTKPGNAAFYRTQSGDDLRAVLDNRGKFSRINNLGSHLGDFFSDAGQQMDLSRGDADLCFLFGYARQDMVSGEFDANANTFTQKNLASAYQTVSELMRANDGLRLHFCWPSYEEPQKNRDMFDAILQQQFGEDRVTIDILKPGESYAEFALDVFAHILPSNISQTAPAAFDADGQLHRDAVTSPQLITLSFPESAAPRDVLFVPDAQASAQGEPETDDSLLWRPAPDVQPGTAAPTAPADGSGAAPDAIALYPSGDGSFWLYLPADAPGGTFRVSYDGAVNSPLPAASMHTYTLPQHTAELALYHGDGLPVEVDGALALHNETTRWTIDVRLEGFTGSDLSPELYAEVLSANGETRTVRAELLSREPTVLEDGACRFEVSLPALGPSSVGTLCLGYQVWGQTCDDARLSFPFTMENRAPVLNQDVESPVALNAYYDLASFNASSDTIELDMSDFFRDEDGDKLTYALDQQAAASDERRYALTDGVLAYTAVSGAEEPFALTVTASDPFGESVACTFVFTHVSAQQVLDSLRVTVEATAPARVDQGVVTLPIYQETTLRLSIPGGELAVLEQIFDRLQLPAISECLRLYADGEPLTLVAAEDGGLAAELPIPSQEHAETRPLRLSAQLICPSAAALDLSHLLEPAQFQIAVENTPPYLRDGVEPENSAGSKSLSGMPGRYAPVSLSDLFGPVIPGELFANDEAREQLNYVLTVQGGGAQLYIAGEPGHCEESDDGTRTFQISGALAEQPLDLRFTSTGSVLVTIRAVDGDGQFADQSVSYSVKLASSFIRLLIIILAVALALTGAAIALFILHRKRMPTFEGCVACISNARTMNELGGESFTTLPLLPFGKDPVAVSALLVASGQMPLRTCPPDALAHICLQPNGRGGVRVTRSDHETESVSVHAGAQEVARNADLGFGEYLLIRTSGGEVLRLLISNAR